MRHYTITAEDVGAAHIRIFNRLWPVSEFLGRIMIIDIGKRVYLRGGVLQVENQEQYTARIVAERTPEFDINVAWLQFMADSESGGSGPTFPHSQRELRLLRNAFDWAMAYPKGQSAPPEAKQSWCECNVADVSDHHCQHRATMHLFRVTAMVHETPIHDTLPTDFCEPCGDKALESGAFCAGDDLLEPHHGPDCIKRMSADASVGEEGGRS